MKRKVILLFFAAGIIIFIFSIQQNFICNFFIMLIYIYMFSLIKVKEKDKINLLNKKDELAFLLNNIPVAAFLKDTDGNIILGNKEFFDFFQIKDISDYKKITKIVALSADENETKHEDDKIIKNKEDVITEKYILKNNTNKKYKIYKTPVKDDRNNVKHIAVFISENKYENSSAESNKDIIATLTHDLKTPAVAQIRAIEMLLKGNFGEISDSQRSFLNDILNSCNNMLDMLINMLWLYKFDNKKVAVNIIPFNINDLIKEIFEENKLMLNSKHHKFEFLLDNNQMNIAADKMHIKRIISNLIMNAISHSKEYSTIYIETHSKDNEIVFKVKNIGNYLSPDILNCIFDKNKVFTQKCDGLSTGLGLYLSNSLLELNGGKLIYGSEENGLNTFGFVLNMLYQKDEHNQTDTKTVIK